MKSVLTVVAVLTVILLSSNVYGAVGDVYANPWIPNWSSDTGYTSQFWDFHGNTSTLDNSGNPTEPAQPYAADHYSINSYGTATATWLDNTAGTVGWTYLVPGSHPSWAKGGYGGNTGGTSAPLTLSIPTSNNIGDLFVYVQYDWYHYKSAAFGDSTITVSIDGATDVTPSGYTDTVIGVSGSGKQWLRTTKVFEITDYDATSISATLSLTGFAPIVDSASVTTAFDATVPATVVPEPATIAIMSIGTLITLRKRRI